MAVNDEDPEKMRLKPIGRDQQGLLYWLQLDQEQNIRLYTEEQDDLDGSTWKCIVRLYFCLRLQFDSCLSFCSEPNVCVAPQDS